MVARSNEGFEDLMTYTEKVAGLHSPKQLVF